MRYRVDLLGEDRHEVSFLNKDLSDGIIQVSLAYVTTYSREGLEIPLIWCGLYGESLYFLFLFSKPYDILLYFCRVF